MDGWTFDWMVVRIICQTQQQQQKELQGEGGGQMKDTLVRCNVSLPKCSSG